MANELHSFFLKEVVEEMWTPDAEIFARLLSSREGSGDQKAEKFGLNASLCISQWPPNSLNLRSEARQRINEKGDYYESITSRKSGHHLSLVQSNLQKSSAGYRDRRSWAPICSKPLTLADPGRSLGFFVPLSIQLENWVTKARPCWKTDAPSELSCPG